MNLTREQVNVLANRFWVAKAAAQKNGKYFAWTSFPDWLEDFSAVAPKDFDPDTHRILYDQERAAGCCKENMTFSTSGKARMRKADKVIAEQKRLESMLRDDNSRLLLAAEIALRLMSCGEGSTLEKIVKEAKAAAGIKS